MKPNILNQSTSMIVNHYDYKPINHYDYEPINHYDYEPINHSQYEPINQIINISQWEGWHPIYYGKYKIPWFQTINQIIKLDYESRSLDYRNQSTRL